jgi:hypothetical protein
MGDLAASRSALTRTGHSSGTNFNLDLEKNVWHCWTDDTGGGALQLFAICEELLDCKECI